MVSFAKKSTDENLPHVSRLRELIDGRDGAGGTARAGGAAHRDGGTGLGLSICQEIVRHLGGTIEFETEVGEGFHLVHAGGINIHPDTKIGDRVDIGRLSSPDPHLLTSTKSRLLFFLVRPPET